MPPPRAASAILALPLSLDRGWLHLPVLLAEDDGDSRCKSIKARHLPALDDSARQLVLAAAHPIDHSLVEIIELAALSE
jgi:hypothetical protein